MCNNTPKSTEQQLRPIQLNVEPKNATLLYHSGTSETSKHLLGGAIALWSCLGDEAKDITFIDSLINQELPRLIFALPYACVGFPSAGNFVFSFLSLLVYIPTTSLSCPFLVSLMFLFHKHLQWKFSCHCARHICIAVPRGKHRLEGKRCVWIAWANMQKDRMRKSDLSFTKIMDAWVTGRHHFRHHLVYYTTVVLCPFFCLWQKKHAHLNVQKSNTNTTICTSKCCHREITERVIHPHLPPSLWASLLLMASSFFLCSLYFPSDSGACFIVFCHVSVIAPTACLMLSI